MAGNLSILIITYNRPHDLLELLIDLSGQTAFDSSVREVLILNNASTDDYTEVVTYINVHPELKIHYTVSTVNLGVARGRNKLMTQAKGEVLLSMDDDMAFDAADALLCLGKLFDDPYFVAANAGIITFRVIYYETKKVQVTAFPHKMYDKYKLRSRFLTAYFAGGAHIMKREAIGKAGLYPEDFHYGMEEYDLSYRLLNAGYTIGYDSTVTVLHKESPLGRQANYRKLQMQWINKSKVAWRYLPLKYFISTAISWGGQYLKHAKGHLGVFLISLFKIAAIPFTEKRTVVTRQTLHYLREVEARLKY